MVERHKFPDSVKMGVPFHDPAGLFFRKEPTATTGPEAYGVPETVLAQPEIMLWPISPWPVSY